MQKIIIQIRKHLTTNLITLGIALIIFVAIFLSIYFAQTRDLIAAINGVTIGGISLLAVGMLMWLGHAGAFDIFAFGFKQLASMFFAKDPRKDGQYHDYREQLIVKRADASYNFLVMIAVGLLAFLAVIVLEIVLHVQLGQ